MSTPPGGDFTNDDFDNPPPRADKRRARRLTANAVLTTVHGDRRGSTTSVFFALSNESKLMLDFIPAGRTISINYDGKHTQVPWDRFLEAMADLAG